MKKIIILGSTGSIGKSALAIAKHLNVPVVGLAAHSNVNLLIAQAKEFNVQSVAIFETSHYEQLKKALPGVKILVGKEGVCELAFAPEANFVISAITGIAGLCPTLKAIEAKKCVALANKEALVAGGALVMKKAAEMGVDILPIDSEHSAIFQCLQGGQKESLKKIILTASGGPFREFSQAQLEKITPEDALCHPTWKMGPKVTIDSATLMNKGLEVIEAHWLFGLSKEKIEVVIHPQSIIHSMVEFMDGSILAQMGEPSMLLPIQYAMTYPKRERGMLPSFDFIQQKKLEFFCPDKEKFPCLELAYFALDIGKSLASFMNGANEVLVKQFLDKKIPFCEIAKRLEKLMLRHQPVFIETLEDVLAADAEGRLLAADKSCLKGPH